MLSFCYIFAKIDNMATTERQTIIRMDESLYQRLKTAAQKEHRSMNSLMVSILDMNTETEDEDEKLDPSDFVPTQEILSLGKILSGMTADAQSYDKKTQYILSK